LSGPDASLWRGNVCAPAVQQSAVQQSAVQQSAVQRAAVQQSAAGAVRQA
jgi:hypothetical protein